MKKENNLFYTTQGDVEPNAKTSLHTDIYFMFFYRSNYRATLHATDRNSQRTRPALRAGNDIFEYLDWDISWFLDSYFYGSQIKKRQDQIGQ